MNKIGSVRISELGYGHFFVTGSGLLDGGEICLFPAQGYQGDAPVDEATLNAETFFFIDEWLEK